MKLKLGPKPKTVVSFTSSEQAVLKKGVRDRQQEREASVLKMQELKLLALDIETPMPTEKTPVPPALIASTALGEGGDVQLWCSRRFFIGPPREMSIGTAQKLVRYLMAQRELGYTICTMNGTAHDFKVLAKASRWNRICQELALQSIDITFQMLCQYGHPVGMQNVLDGFNLPSKYIMPLSVPEMWEEGEYKECFKRVTTDTALTLLIYEHIIEEKKLKWKPWGHSQPKIKQIYGLPTVRELLAQEPKPVAWIESPWTRAEFVKWMNLSKENVVYEDESRN